MNEQAALNNPNVKAFGDMVAHFESRGDYTVLYGGGHFSDFSAHPHVKVPFFNPATQKQDFSTAAGKYQINWPTWLTVQALGTLPDFSPASQEIAFVRLLKIDGALDYVVSGDFRTAIEKASKTWASMPLSTSGQNKTTLAGAQNVYQAAGGSIAIV